MAKNKTTSRPDENKKIKERIKNLKKQADTKIKEIEEYRKKRCFVLWATIYPSLVEEVFEELRTKYQGLNGSLDVILNSDGGDIDAAYNLACLFQKYANKELSFIIPRWSKSAATLLACAGETIYMSPIAELGPIDPQITQVNPMEERFERFSPLHIRTTLDMIREEYQNGNKDLADGLLKRLQFPLTLGSFLKSHEIGVQYLERLLRERMEKTKKLNASPNEIAETLSRKYADHGFCINIQEAQRIGLNCEELEGDLLNLTSEFYHLYKQKEHLKRKIRQDELTKLVKSLPPEILKDIKIDDALKQED